jgi:hypothetical protein
VKTIPLIFLFAGLTAAQGAALAEDPIKRSAQAFLSAPTLTVQRLADGRGGRDLITARNGHVLAFHHQTLRESADGGISWSSPREVGPDAGVD